jgi:hypothetical protein
MPLSISICRFIEVFEARSADRCGAMDRRHKLRRRRSRSRFAQVDDGGWVRAYFRRFDRLFPNRTGLSFGQASPIDFSRCSDKL